VQPAAVVTAALHSIAEAYRAKRVRLLTDIAAGRPELSLDQDRFGHVLANLLHNTLRTPHPQERITASALLSPEQMAPTRLLRTPATASRPSTCRRCSNVSTELGSLGIALTKGLESGSPSQIRLGADVVRASARTSTPQITLGETPRINALWKRTDS
jgi:hypothetical protein